MARIDVSDALLDPDYIDNLVCVRGEQSVGDDGIASSAQTEIPFVGVVTVKDPSSLDRTPAGERIRGAITVVTKFQLVDGADGLTADVVRFKGKSFTVAEVGDYSHYGRGFVQATCDLLPLTGGPAPSEEPLDPS